jgi:hypothetical protein
MCVWCDAMRCGCVQRRRQSYAQKKFRRNCQCHKMHGRKSAARMTELTELTHNQPTVSVYYALCCGNLLPRRDRTGHDATRPARSIKHQCINIIVLYYYSNLLWSRRRTAARKNCTRPRLLSPPSRVVKRVASVNPRHQKILFIGAFHVAVFWSIF